MHGYMNEEALKKTIASGEAHYWSRSRRGDLAQGQPAVWFRILRKCGLMMTKIACGCACKSAAMAQAAMSAIARAFIALYRRRAARCAGYADV